MNMNLLPKTIEHFIYDLVHEGSKISGYKITTNKLGVSVTLQFSDTNNGLLSFNDKSPSRIRRDETRMTEYNTQKNDIFIPNDTKGIQRSSLSCDIATPIKLAPEETTSTPTCVDINKDLINPNEESGYTSMLTPSNEQKESTPIGYLVTLKDAGIQTDKSTSGSDISCHTEYNTVATNTLNKTSKTKSTNTTKDKRDASTSTDNLKSKDRIIACNLLQPKDYQHSCCQIDARKNKAKSK